MSHTANLVRETATTTGTGDFTVSAITGWRRASDAFGTSGRKCLYTIRHDAAAEYEVGYGHMSDANTLVRDEVVESSNSNALVSFASGSKDVVCSATAQFIGQNRNTPNAGALLWNGFDRGTRGSPETTLPTGWSWHNQGTATYTEHSGSGTLVSPAGSNTAHIVAAIPSASTFKARCELVVSAKAATFVRSQMLVSRTTNSTAVVLDTVWESAVSGVDKYITNFVTFSAAQGTTLGMYGGTPTFIEIEKLSATSWTFRVSMDGKVYVPVLSAYDVTAHLGGAPDEIGWGFSCSNGVVAGCSCHWFEVR
jgi:hypothetical protein